MIKEVLVFILFCLLTIIVIQLSRIIASNSYLIYVKQHNPNEALIKEMLYEEIEKKSKEYSIRKKTREKDLMMIFIVDNPDNEYVIKTVICDYKRKMLSIGYLFLFYQKKHKEEVIRKCCREYIDRLIERKQNQKALLYK